MRKHALPSKIKLKRGVILVEILPEQLKDEKLGGMINVANHKDSRFAGVIKSRSRKIKSGHTILLPKVGNKKFDYNGKEVALVLADDVWLWF